MTEINETRLPGVGVRYDFASVGGDKVGVVSYHSGRRDVVIYGSEATRQGREPIRLAGATPNSAGQGSTREDGTRRHSMDSDRERRVRGSASAATAARLPCSGVSGCARDGVNRSQSRRRCVVK